jgi:ribosomal protein S18 acetylase RimI-like enzyme
MNKIDIKQLNDIYKRAGVDWNVHIHDNSIQYCEYDGSKLMGFCQVMSDGTVVNLVVDREYRNKGIGSKLLKHAIGGGGVYLRCLYNNIDFYTNRGFKIYCVKYSKEYGEDMYYMRTGVMGFRLI